MNFEWSGLFCGISNWKRRLVDAVFLAVVAGVFAMAYQGRSFAAKTVFQVFRFSESDDLRALLKSPQLVRDAAKSRNLPQRWNMTEEEIDRNLREMVEFSAEKASDVISVQVFGDDPVEAADLANAVRDRFHDRLQSAERERFEQRETARTNQMKVLKRELEVSGMELETGTRSKLRAQLHEVTGHSAHVGDDLMDGRILLGPDNETLSRFVATMRADRMDVMRLRDRGFGERHPKVIQLRQRIDKSNELLIAALQNSRVPHPSMVSGLTPKAVSSEAATDYFNRVQEKHARNLQLLEELELSVARDHVTSYMPRHPMGVLQIAKPATSRVWRIPPVSHLVAIGAAAVTLLIWKGVAGSGRRRGDGPLAPGRGNG